MAMAMVWAVSRDEMSSVDEGRIVNVACATDMRGMFWALLIQICSDGQREVLERIGLSSILGMAERNGLLQTSSHFEIYAVRVTVNKLCIW